MKQSHKPDGSRTSDYNYELPAEQIAQYPSRQRSDSRLLVMDKENSTRRDSIFRDLAQWLRAGDLLVLNDVKVLPARLYGQRQTGGRMELLLERILQGRRALVQLRSNRSLKIGETLQFEGVADFVVRDRKAEFFEVEYLGDADLYNVFVQYGHIPLPPYIQRTDEQRDRQDYQTVYASRPGAVAAPTAGLHFTQDLLVGLEQAGMERAYVTLYVGAGTFKPVKQDDPSKHVMHRERFEISTAACAAIRRCKQRGGRIIAVGTTTVRVLESVAQQGELQPLQAETDLFIRPGFRFQLVDGLITNFHLPQSTLLMLVSAFAGYGFTMESYRYAVAQGYRFFSYGDAMLIL